MRLKIFYILFFFLITFVPFTIYGNTNTREYCDELLHAAIEESNQKNYGKSLELLLKMENIAKNSVWLDLQANALNLIGLIYMDVLDSEKAIESFSEAYDVAIKGDCQTEQLSILNNIASVYFDNNDIVKAKKYFNKAYEGAKKINDTNRIIAFAINLGLIENHLGELRQAEDYWKIADKLIDFHPAESFLITMNRFLKIKNLILSQQYGLAEKLALETLDYINQLDQSPLKIECLMLLSHIFEEKKEFDKAISYAHKALNSNPDLSTKVNIYEQLSSLYKNTHSVSFAIEYKDSLIMAKDSLAKLNDIMRMANNQVRFILLNTEQDIIENKAQLKTERITYFFILIFILLISMILIWIFRMKWVKNRQQKVITELQMQKEKNEKLLLEQQLKEQEVLSNLEQERLNNERTQRLLLEQQLKEQETSSILEQERLNNEINIKNRQLAAKVMFQSDRNKIIKEIINILSHTKLSKIRNNNELESAIEELNNQLEKSSRSDDFLTYFEMINPNFLSSLKEKHPDLLVNEIDLLSYIYLSLETKEIAKLLNITDGSCRKRKLRIATKMGVSVSGLYDYLINEIGLIEDK
jgi:tetratricopeptide (TPR) repeat protein